MPKNTKQCQFEWGVNIWPYAERCQNDSAYFCRGKSSADDIFVCEEHTNFIKAKRAELYSYISYISLLDQRNF